MARPRPFASVIVRSFRRPAPLLELIARLRRQRYPMFEIVVVEQSEDERLCAQLDALGDPRLRVLRRPPLGAPGARNEGVRHARGEILVFIDDDDLPIGDGWIAAHVANYTDPECMGVCGRLSTLPDGPRPLRFPRLVRWAAFRYSAFKDPVTLAFGELRKPGITFLVGNNFSIRRSLVDRVGGWDEGIPMGEEHSFFFKYQATRRRGEYMVYDPVPVVWRRLDIDGGLARRTREDWFVNELRGRVVYYHAVIRHYFAWRFWVLYPLFVLRAAQQVLVWIWDPDQKHRGILARLRASLATLVVLPVVTWRDGVRLRPGSIRRVPTLARLTSGP